MIPLAFQAESSAVEPFVTRLCLSTYANSGDSILLSSNAESSVWSGAEGLFEVRNAGHQIEGDVLLVDPLQGRAERLIRANSDHNTLLITERCDQLCVMCSQPPKKTHVDRFDYFERACLLAPHGLTIGLSGGEPTLFLERLLALMERVLNARPDLSFHVLTNAQHFEKEQILRLRDPIYSKVVWGIPLYAADKDAHDHIVGKKGAFDRLVASLANLLLAGARVELRTVLMGRTVETLEDLARFVVRYLSHVEQWSLMGLENVGFAKNRWSELFFETRQALPQITKAINIAVLHDVRPLLFNIPLCHLPDEYRPFAVQSISDWKQRYGEACEKCARKPDCSGFFEWHPDHLVEEVNPL